MAKLSPWSVLFCLGVGLSAEQLLAQSVLPANVGLYRFSYRGFGEQSEKFNTSGELSPLGQSFNREFNGDNLLNGAGGSDLQRLARELKEFDGKDNQSPDSLVKSLNLGRLHGDVKANVNAKIFGLGFGFTDRFTAYVGVPFVSASVDTRLSFDGSNNAQDIKARLGDAAFDRLKDGLDRASRINADEVERGIMDKGYAPVSHWEKSGLGDVQVGGLYVLGRGYANGWGYGSLLDSSLSLPTGYVDDPDVLTDISFGNGGYFALTEKLSASVTRNIFVFGGESFLTLGLPTERNVRLPEGDEQLTDADRKTKVRMSPGHAYGMAGDAGLNFGLVRTGYRLGFKRKFADAYSGSREGNYKLLAKGSDSMQTYSEISAALDTTQLYRRKDFPIPFIMAASYHFPHQGVNSSDERYYELSLSSFFQVPGSERRRDTREASTAHRGRR